MLLQGIFFQAGAVPEEQELTTSPGALALQDLRVPLGDSHPSSQEEPGFEGTSFQESAHRHIQSFQYQSKERLSAAQGLLSPAAARSQAVLGTRPTGTVTSCSFPVLPQAGESIFPPLGQPELPFAGRGEIAQRLRATA